MQNCCWLAHLAMLEVGAVDNSQRFIETPCLHTAKPLRLHDPIEGVKKPQGNSYFCYWLPEDYRGKFVCVYVRLCALEM